MTDISIKLCYLPLEPATLARLQKCGFVSTSEVEDSIQSNSDASLAAELDCTPAEAACLAKQVEDAVSLVRSNLSERSRFNGGSSATISTSVTAASLLSRLKNKESSKRTIISFCRSLDTLLGGGIGIGQVTEIVGLSGVGKTQLAMQLCVDARLPRKLGGVEGESVFIDSEGGFCAERCKVMSEALVHHVRRNKTRQRSSVPSWLKPETILDGIHVFRVHDEAIQAATIYALDSFLQKRADMGTPVRLVVVDSIAFHYRCSQEDYMARTRSLTSLAGFLAKLAFKFDVAVVTINQITTKVGNPSSSSLVSDTTASRLVPALGPSWAHASTTRVTLSRTENESVRRCELVKSPVQAVGTAHFRVLESGIRDICREGSQEQNATNGDTVFGSRTR